LSRGQSASVRPLGVGLNYQKEFRDFAAHSRGSVDFLEVVPDIAWIDRGAHAQPRYVDDADAVGFLAHLRMAMPMVAHSIGLSIGSAHLFDRDHVEQIARWHERFAFAWHSDHLAFNLAAVDGTDALVGPLALNLDHESLDLVVERVRFVMERVPIPFALETNVSYVTVLDEDFTEPEFLNAVCSQTGSGVLLDLHNVHVNEINLGVRAMDYLDQLDLDNVLELHVAGGNDYDDFYVDSHSGPVPERVWDLVEHVVPKCPNLGGIVFELLGSWHHLLGDDGLETQLTRARELWVRHSRVPSY
jgi:uncharacterized protein (UPF0276 family)